MIRCQIDPTDIAEDGDWQVFEVTPHYRRSRLWLDETRYIVRTEYIADAALLEANRQAFNTSEGKRWGDGQVAARIPLNVFFNSDIARKIKDGDRDHLKWWLDRDEAKPYRTFKGRIS